MALTLNDMSCSHPGDIRRFFRSTNTMICYPNLKAHACKRWPLSAEITFKPLSEHPVLYSFQTQPHVLVHHRKVWRILSKSRQFSINECCTNFHDSISGEGTVG